MGADLETVWERDEAQRKGAALSRESIVAAALAIADAEGLQAVSIRRIATELGARPMSLYSHIERKDDLIDLMIDEVMGGALLTDAVPDEWREALRQIAAHTRAVARAHPWMIGAAFHRPMLGPNALRHIDQSLEAVASLDLPDARKSAVLLTVDTYTLGFAGWEVRLSNGIGASGKSDAIAAYIADQAGSGEYPNLAKLTAADYMRFDVSAQNFEVGLEWLLAGVEAEAAARKSGGE